MTEPDNLVLAQLRAMTARFDNIESKLDARFAEPDRRFESIDKQLEEVRFQGTYTLGLVGTLNLKTREWEAWQAASEARHKRADAATRELERRVGKLEKPDTAG